jgi:hypothetical protein
MVRNDNGKSFKQEKPICVECKIFAALHEFGENRAIWCRLGLARKHGLG